MKDYLQIDTLPFVPNAPFYGFLMFSWGRENAHWERMRYRTLSSYFHRVLCLKKENERISIAPRMLS